MHRLTFWFPLLFLSFYLSISSPLLLLLLVCFLVFFFSSFYVFSCLWSTPNKGLGDGEDVHV